MKYGGMILMTIALLALAMSPCMAAQDTGAAEWIWRTGILFPTGDTVDSTEFTAGIEYGMPIGHPKENTAEMLSLSLDYTSISTTTSDGGTDDVTLIPVLVNMKDRRALGSNRAWTLGVGIGVFFASDEIPDMDLSDGTSFAWQVMTAYDITRSLGLEVRYIAGSHPSDDGLFAVELDHKF